jgi:hypothetical protein
MVVLTERKYLEQLCSLGIELGEISLLTAIGYQLFVIGYSLLDISYWLFDISYWLLVIV